MSIGPEYSKAKYFDDTNDHDEEVAWELEATGHKNDNEDNRRMVKVIQTKVATDKDDPNVSIVTTTTFNRQNILERTKSAYA